MLLSYKWDGWMGWKSLCGATIRASLCNANNFVSAAPSVARKIIGFHKRGGGGGGPPFYETFSQNRFFFKGWLPLLAWRCGGGDDCHIDEQESLKNGKVLYTPPRDLSVHL